MGGDQAIALGDVFGGEGLHQFRVHQAVRQEGQDPAFQILAGDAGAVGADRCALVARIAAAEAILADGRKPATTAPAFDEAGQQEARLPPFPSLALGMLDLAAVLVRLHLVPKRLVDDAQVRHIGDLVDMEVFASETSETQSFDTFLDGVVVISLDALGQDDRSKNMLVAVMLNMFYENMLRTPKRPFIGSDPQLRAVDSYLLVDVADNIMRYEFDVLRKLLLQGREFGTGVILASQYLRHFKVNATDYREPLLSWFVHKVPNVTPAELSALGLTAGAAEMAERVKALQVHQCLYKSFDVSGEVVRGLPFFELEARREKRGE